MSDDETMPRWPDMDPAKRCIAHKPDGSQCLRARKPGTTVCEAHGSRPAHVKAAAARRVADAKALELASQVGVEIPQFTSAGDAASYLVNRVTRRAVQFGTLADQLGTLTYTDRAGVERLRAAIDGERKWLESMTKVLGVAVAAARPAAEPRGPDAVEIFKLTVSLFFEDVSSALTDLGIEGGQYEAIMDRVEARSRMRLKQSGGMILEQVRIMAGAGG